MEATMNKKPTYEELLARINELELESGREKASHTGGTLLRTLIETIPDLVWLKNPDGVYLACNRRFERFFNTPEKDIVGKTDYDFLSKDEADFFRKKDLAAIDSGKPVANEETITYLDDGHEELLETIKTPMFDSEGNLIGVLGVARDITERKRIEQELQFSEERLRMTLEVAHIGIWDWNVTEDIWYASPTYYTMLGYEPVSGLSERETWLQRVHPEDREMVSNRIQSILNNQTSDYQYEARMKHADGSYRWHFVIGFVLKRDQGGKPTHLRGLRIDIDERIKAEIAQKRLEAELTQAQRMEAIGRLAGGVAHDFNNMLGVIIGQAELLLEQTDPTNPIFPSLQGIRKAAENSANLTRQLLAFARKQAISPQVLDLNQVVGSMSNMLQRIIGEDIHLVWAPGKNTWPVMIDASQIDQILANLCVNARNSIEGVGKITIETKNVFYDATYGDKHPGHLPGEYVMLAVTDSGIGMDQQIINNIFEPFFTTKEKGKGTGLGLATVYGIVKQNQGFIDVYSEVGHGSTFKIYLPRHLTGKRTQRRELKADPIEYGTETVLLVEDNIEILNISQIMLEKQGYTVLNAASPGEAIRLVEEYGGNINLLITDVIMPEMNGRDLAENLKSRCPSLKVLYMSGYTEDVIAHHGVIDKDINFIQKPFSIRELSAQVKEALK